MDLVVQSVFKTDKRRIKPSLAGSIPALSAIFESEQSDSTFYQTEEI